MTAENRIETLLNMANNTISDLPKPGEYSMESLNAALDTVAEWAGVRTAGIIEIGAYICHLADVIDRMEWALSNTLMDLRDMQSRETATPKGDLINHPAHYNSGKVEAIDYLDSIGAGRKFCVGNAIKYMARADHKGKKAEDLKKARFYVQHLLDTLEDVTDLRDIKITSTLTIACDWKLSDDLTAALIGVVAGDKRNLELAVDALSREIERAEEDDNVHT